MRRFVLAAAIAASVAANPAYAHQSGECDDTLALTVRIAEGKARVADWLLKELNTFRDVERLLSLMSTYMDTDAFFMEMSEKLVECLKGTEPK